MAPPPPSFSSFPDLSSGSSSGKVKPAPPSFNSFPAARDDAESPARPTKRPRGNGAFLDGLADELEATGKSLSGASGSREKSASSRSRDKDKDKDGHRSSRHGHGEREREKDKDRERDEGRHHKSRSSKGKKRDPDERESDYGVKTDKPYKLVKSLLNNDGKRPESPPPPPQEKDEKRLFYSDRRGDEYNIRYGSLHKGDIPRYRRLGAGRIVGLNAGLRITKETAYTNRGLEVGAHTSYRTPRYTDPRSLQHATSRHTKRLTLLSSSTNPSNDPFLPSPTNTTRFVPFPVDPTPASLLAQLEFEPGQDYRSIAGLLPPSALDPTDINEDEEEEDDAYSGLGIEGGESHSAFLARRAVELDRAVRSDPTNVTLWIDFVALQDDIALSSFGGAGRSQSKKERTSTAEIKLSILDRALVANPSSELLLLAYLRAVSEVWDPKAVRGKWDEVLRKHPGLTGLWIEYVGWRQTSWVNFDVRDVVECFAECFKVLGAAAEKEKEGSTEREILEGNEIYLFLRCCLMLRQAGFAERALAAFQSLIELNFFRPPPSTISPSPPHSYLNRAFDSLESFWDSGAPRIGEPGSLGWSNSLSASTTPPPPPSRPTPVPPTTADDPLHSWSSLERTHALPARPDDPDVDDDVDPYRVVLFDDVRDFLFVVHSPDSRTQLAYAFLTFLGLPFVPPDFPTSTAFSTDGNAPASVDGLFGGRPKWFEVVRKGELGHVDVEFVRNVFTSLRPFVQDGFFTLDFFAFESAVSPKLAVKLAKTVLRTERQNLSLWDGYARIERARGKLVEARQVYVTALSMYREFEPRDQIDGPLLWRAWAEMEWESGRPMLALQVLVTSANVGTEHVDLASLAHVDPNARPPPALILKARQHYTSLLESSFQPSVPQSTLRNRNHVAYSFAIFEYCSTGLAAAVAVLEQHLFRLDCAGALGGAEHEEAFMSYAKLLYRRASGGGGFRPGQLRDVLERAIKEFPNNSLFLCLFYHNELRMKIQNRVRRTLELSVLADKSVTSEGWIFAIYAELHLDARSHNVCGVRNLFDRAIENPRTRSSASIWTLFIDFEIRNGELARAKALLYRGIRECPWVKELYLKPFALPFRAAFRAKELQQLHSLLLEKGLRVRVELEEFGEGGGDSDVEMGVEEPDEAAGGLVKETEELYEERRRLMPY
ncbi:hypothetical protein RQP46_009062 [Phenoliferia psychrophenolica]